jgi:hypothetical protein
VERKPIGMRVRNEQKKTHLLIATRTWIFLLMLFGILVFSFALLRYRSQQNAGKQSDFVQTKRHVYVQPTDDQPDVPIVYARSL